MPYYYIEYVGQGRKHGGVRWADTSDVNIAFRDFFSAACRRHGMGTVKDFDCMLLSDMSPKVTSLHPPPSG